jgi:hypothetical protein
MLEEARRLSGVVFVAPYRLEVAAAIHRMQLETFKTSELQGILDPPLDHDNNAGRQLKRLEEAGLVESVDKLWHPKESPFWAHCDKWLRHLLGEEDTEDVEEARAGVGEVP